MTLRKAIVVDDDPLLAQAFKGVLELSNFEVMIITDSQKAIDAIRKFSPLLITLDMQMPFISGDKLLQQIRNDEELKHIKVIVISATTEAQRSTEIQDEADLILSKPVTLTQLQTFIQRILPPISSLED